MSSISDVYSSYSDALNFSREKFDDLYTSRALSTGDSYHTFFHQPIYPLNYHFTDSLILPSLGTLQRQIEWFYCSGRKSSYPYQSYNSIHHEWL